MDSRTKIAAGAVGAATVIALGAGAGLAAGAGDDERPLRGTAYERATAAALDHVGGGTVIETEAGDDGAAYEVEIRREEGTQVEVELDASFDVVGAEPDDDAKETPGDD